jgi:Ca-activated chloride channel family protein
MPIPRRGFIVLATLAALAACKRSSPPGAPDAPAAGEVRLVVAYGSEKKSWFEEQARAFEASGTTTKSGKRIRVEGRAMGSGEATQAILDGSLKPHVFSPASGAYITILNQRWLGMAGHTAPLSPAGEPVVLSPVVIAMWKPMAEALGWPAKALGWKDLLKVVREPKGWAAHGRPEWGAFKFGHTHPAYSNSGLLGVLAEAYAGAGKVRDMTAADLDAAKTKAFLAEVEGAVVHYGKSTGFFAEKMRQRGPSYLSAAVLYENLVIESYAQPANVPLVAIYPVEGTFWSDHPYAILDAAWVSAEEREAAQLFLAALKSRPAQERALQHGFRPADASIPISAPVDAAHGADPKQPQTLLDVPPAPVLQKLLDAWEVNKRAADVTLVFDKSGSMNGRPMEEARAGARAFVEGLGARDQMALIFFDNQIYDTIGPVALEGGRPDLLSRLAGVTAGGGTSLYDAIARGYDETAARNAKDPRRIHAVVVMTDGKDESSHQYSLADLQIHLNAESSPVKVFTIAYGNAADPQVLQRIADAGQGSFARGTAENIVQVYQDVAAFF